MSLRQVHYGELKKPEDSVRFVCISDTHYVPMQHPIPDGDVLLCAGDFSRGGRPRSIEAFSQMLKALPHRRKIVIAGNHEYSFDRANIDRLNLAHKLDLSHDVDRTKSYLRHCEYLEDAATTVFGYKVWGSPWVNGYRDGGFTLWNEGEIQRKWELIPADTDILLTHTPPHGILDINKYGEHGGCPHLTEKSQQLQLTAHIFGHIHEAHGFTVQQSVVYVNAAICNLDYDTVNRPVVVDLPQRAII